MRTYRATRRHKITAVKQEPENMDDKEYSQVLNLISNAIKYSPNANKINVTASFDEEKITVCVQDFGIGISPELQDKIFDRFFRSYDPAIQTYPGLGLGLYIAAGIIKRKKGNIWLKSKKGKGSTFCFSLPVKKTAR
jgi:signal transduction histidine kinase